MITQCTDRIVAAISVKSVKKADKGLRAEGGSHTSESKGTSEERTHHE